MVVVVVENMFFFSIECVFFGETGAEEFSRVMKWLEQHPRVSTSFEDHEIHRVGLIIPPTMIYGSRNFCVIDHAAAE